MKRHVGAEPRRSDRLVGALPARPQRKARAEQRLAHARRPLGAIGGVGDEDAEDDDRLGGHRPTPRPAG